MQRTPATTLLRCVRIRDIYSGLTLYSGRWAATITCSALLVVGGAFSDALEPTQVPHARLTLSVEELDFGEVWADEEPSKTVLVGNAGDEALEINGLHTTCRCARASISKTMLQPGESTELTVTLALHDYRSNMVKSKVILCTNDPACDIQYIAVRGRIRPEFVVEPPQLDFGRVKRGQSPARTLTVCGSGHIEVKITGVEAPPGLTAFVVAPSRKDQEKGTDKPTSRPDRQDIQVQIAPEARAGRLSKKLILLTNLKRVPKFPVRVTAQVVGIEYTIKPRVLVFGPSPPGAEAGVVDVAGLNELEVIDATCTVEDITLGVEVLEPRKRHRIKVILKDKATPGTKIGRILLKLKEGPLVETKHVTVYGTVEYDRAGGSRD